MKPKISVIVPIYNVAKYVEACMMSILAQDYDNLEVIIVDDCTPDNSMEIVKSTIASHPSTNIQFLLLRHETNKGISASRNMALEHATGEWIMFVDSDDTITEGCCTVLASKASTGDYDMIIGNRNIYDEVSGVPLHQGVRPQHDIIMTNMHDYVANKVQGEAYNKLIKKSFLTTHNLHFEPGILYEDTLFTQQMLCFHPRIIYIPFVTYNYLFRKGSIMNTFSEKHLYSRIKSAIVAYKFASELMTEEAAEMAYQFRKIALSYMLSGTRKGIFNFFKLYRFLKKRFPLKPMERKLNASQKSCVQHIRLTANKLPSPFDAVMELIFVFVKNMQLKGVMQNGKRLSSVKGIFKRIKEEGV